MSAIETALLGTLGRDGELKTSKSGRNYLRLNVAVSADEATQWITVSCFDPKAIENAVGFTKGARCYVEGRLSLDKWTAQDGTERSGLSVMSRHTRLAEIGRAQLKREKSQPASRSQSVAAGSTLDDDRIPFAPEWRG
jgi:single-stranded DNA-binding protein